MNGLALSVCMLFMSSSFISSMPPAPPAAVMSSQAALAPEESEFVRLTNETRLKSGLHELSVDPALVQAARNHSREMADRLGALVVVPRFDRERFPGSKYNGGGLMGAGSEVAPRDTWTWSMIPQLIDEVRKLEHRPEMPVYVIGHSAGGQFAERLSAFVPIDARRIVVANAGVHLFPSRDLPFAFGFGKLPPELGGDQAIRAYLAQPITIYLGTGDTERDENLATGEYADDEGRTRLERGRNVFQRAEALARERGWPFHWRLVEAPGVAHDHAAMFNHPQCREALFGEEPSAP